MNYYKTYLAKATPSRSEGMYFNGEWSQSTSAGVY